MDGDAAENGPFDFESKLEKRDVTTAPVRNIVYEIETHGLRQSDVRNSTRALQNSNYRFVIECQSLCHLRSEYWTEEQAGPSFRRQSEILNECEMLAGNTIQPISDVSPVIAESYQMIRETGNRR